MLVGVELPGDVVPWASSCNMRCLHGTNGAAAALAGPNLAVDDAPLAPVSLEPRTGSALEVVAIWIAVLATVAVVGGWRRWWWREVSRNKVGDATNVDSYSV